MSFTTFIQKKVFHNNPYVKAFFQFSPSSLFRSNTSKVLGVATTALLGLYAFHHYRPQAFQQTTKFVDNKVRGAYQGIRKDGIWGSFRKVCVLSSPSTKPNHFDDWVRDLSSLCNTLIPHADENSLVSKDPAVADKILQVALEEFLMHTLPLRGYYHCDEGLLDHEKESIKEKNIAILTEKLKDLLVFLTRKDLSKVEKDVLKLSDGWRFKTFTEMRSSYFFTFPLATKYDSYAPGDIPDNQLKAKREKLAPALAKYIATHPTYLELDKLKMGNDQVGLNRLACTCVMPTELTQLGPLWNDFIQKALEAIKGRLEHGEKNPPENKDDKK